MWYHLRQCIQWLYSLTCIFLPESIASIGWNPFFDYNKLCSIKIAESNWHFVVVDGIIFNTAMATLISYGKCTERYYTISDSVGKIGSCAFQGSKLLLSVVSIGYWALSDCFKLNYARVPIGLEYPYCAFLKRTTKDKTGPVTNSLPQRYNHLKGRKWFNTFSRL